MITDPAYVNAVRPLDSEPPITSMMRDLAGAFQRFIDRGYHPDGSSSSHRMARREKRAKRAGVRTREELRAQKRRLDAEICDQWLKTNESQRAIALRLGITQPRCSQAIVAAGLSNLKGKKGRR